ncbi:MAG: SxtJ family membrane protein [Gammaproteobacteria bacterium]
MKKPTATKKELRQFGYMMGFMLILIFGLVAPFLFDYQGGRHAWNYRGFVTPVWPWAAACAFWLTALLLPKILSPVYRVWMWIGHVLGWINTRIIMAILFYLLILPMGLLLRLFGKDPMKKRLDKSKSSYRIPSDNPENNHIERPY